MRRTIAWRMNRSLSSGSQALKHVIFPTLSGGEQQRVILARALTQQTECLVLDEPTNHLDIKYQLEIMDIVKGLGHTVVAAVHDLNIASMYCTSSDRDTAGKWWALVRLMSS